MYVRRTERKIRIHRASFYSVDMRRYRVQKIGVILMCQNSVTFKHRSTPYNVATRYSVHERIRCF